MPDAATHSVWRIVHPLDESDASLYFLTDSVVRWTRNSVTVAADEEVSYGTYFGALPVGYWHHHTDVRRLELVFRADGPVELSIVRTEASGEAVRHLALDIAPGEASVAVDVAAFDDGWLWPEFRGCGRSVTISGIEWRAAGPEIPVPRVTVAITTFDREEDCVRLLQALATPELDHAVRRVVVADQGRRALADAPALAAPAGTLGDRLTVTRQHNLGGSGGFSRGMWEAADEDDDFVLLLDDDVRLEPESVLRLIAFAAHVRTDAIVGAQMLSLIEPTQLHSFGERVDRRGVWWSAVDPSLSDVDLGRGIRAIPALSRRIDVDFNGWWMCLVPTSLVRAVGASLPFFIKWDDAEFGLRAADAGVPTVTLPGAALWHMPWTAKDDGLDWQAYFQLRNRVITALLHGGRGVLRESFALDVNHILCAQYGSVALRNTALRDVLLGPAHLDPVLEAGPTRATRILARMGQVIRPLEDAPAGVDVDPDPPRGAVALLVQLVRVIARQLRRARTGSDRVPHLPRAAGKWWALGVVDEAVVDAASGAGVFVFRRDRAVALRQLRLAIALRARLWWRWSSIARAYRDDAPALAGRAAWHARFSSHART